MRPIIEFCTNNMHHGTEKVMKELERSPEYDVVEYGCLGNCGECYMFPYALVNGEIVPAETADQLLERIMDKIKEIQEMDRILGE